MCESKSEKKGTVKDIKVPALKLKKNPDPSGYPLRQQHTKQLCRIVENGDTPILLFGCEENVSRYIQSELSPNFESASFGSEYNDVRC